MGHGELVDKKLLDNAIKDMKSRSIRLNKCLNSIQELNNPGECRDTAKKIYSVGGASGVEMERIIWLDDGGRHVVLGFFYGNSDASDTVPADFEKTPSIPAGVHIDLHLGSRSSGNSNKTPNGTGNSTGKNK